MEHGIRTGLIDFAAVGFPMGARDYGMEDAPKIESRYTGGIRTGLTDFAAVGFPMGAADYGMEKAPQIEESNLFRWFTGCRRACKGEGLMAGTLEFKDCVNTCKGKGGMTKRERKEKELALKEQQLQLLGATLGGGQRKGGMGTGSMIAIGVVVLLLIVGGIVMATRKKKK